MRFVTKTIHAWLDYPVALALIALPFLLGLGFSKPTHVMATCDVLAAWLTGSSPDIEIGEKDVAASQESSRVASPVP